MHDKDVAAVGLLAAGILGAWTAGSTVMFAAEVLLLSDLPPLPLGHLIQEIAGSGLRWALLGLPAGGAVAFAAVFIPWARRRVVLRFGWGVLLGMATLLPPVASFFLSETWGVGGTLAAAAVVVALSITVGILTARRSGTRGAGIAALAVLISPLWLGVLSLILPAAERPGTPLASAQGRRVVLLGMDGASWTIIDDMRKKGELPRIDALISRGVRANLRSLQPTLSNMVWTSAVTGVVPQRHGITDFVHDRRFIRVPTAWDLVYREGGRIGLYEFLVTNPPLPVNGYVIPGWLAGDWAESHPKKLVKRLRFLGSIRHPYAAMGTWLSRADPRSGGKERMHARIVATTFIDLQLRFDLDLMACVWYGTDGLGHWIWRYYEPEAFEEPPPPDAEQFRDALPAYYREMDRQIGRVIESLDDGNTIFILMSDHGMGPADKIETAASVRGHEAVIALGLEDRFYAANAWRFVNARLETRLESGTVPVYEHTSAVEEAAARFRAVTRVDTGAPLFSVEYGDLESVDLKIDIADTDNLNRDTLVRVQDKILPAEDIVIVSEVSGSHRLDGILVMAGEGIRRGVELDSVSIMDIAPTVIHSLGLPVASDLDGRLIIEAFSPDWHSAHPVNRVASYPSMPESPTELPVPTQDLIEKLVSLGYVGISDDPSSLGSAQVPTAEPPEDIEYILGTPTPKPRKALEELSWPYDEACP